MRKIFVLLLLVGLFINQANAQWGKAPASWGDFAIGLTDDGTKVPIISAAITAGTKLQYRVRYINEGVDTLTNWYSHLPSGGLASNFITASTSLGMRAAFNIYMLQEDNGADKAISNMNDINFMRRFIWNIKNVAQKSNGKKVAFIIEPDTWGYLIKKCYGAGPTSAGGDPTIRPNLVFCHVNDLGYPHLAGLPNTMAGLAQGIIKTIRTFAPDAFVGFHSNHWAVWSNGATGSPCLGTAVPSGGFYQCQAGMPFWGTNDIDVNANFQLAWYQELLGGASSCDKGDFFVVEKYGFDEGGRWVAFGAGASVLYYGNAEYVKWINWCKKLGQGLNLPLLGWQIPIGNSTLPNTIQKYKDGMMENFFANKTNYFCAGFIGLFMGPGVGASTYYTNSAGATGDDGWFFSNLRSQLDPSRPINMNVSTNGCGGTVTTTSGCTSLPLHLLSFAARLQNDQPHVMWLTVNEKNVSHFVLEKSYDGVHFTDLAIVAANNSNKESYYSYDDRQPAVSVTFYRLRSVDEDGTYSYSKVVALSNASSSLVNIYPNPASGIVSVEVPYYEGSRYRLKVYSQLGAEVLATNITAFKTDIDLTGIQPSLYLYRLYDDVGVVQAEGKLLVK